MLNGGIGSLDEAEQHLAVFDGVMLGRAAYHTPYILSDVDRRLFGGTGPPVSRHAVLERLVPYVGRQLAAGRRLNAITRHILGLYHGCPGGRAFRRHLSEHAVRPGAGVDVLYAALEIVGRAAEGGGGGPERRETAAVV